VTQLFDLLRWSARDIGEPGFDEATGWGLLDVPAALADPAPAIDPEEPNDDVDQVVPGRLFRNAELYAPERRGRADVLVGGGKILAVEPRELKEMVRHIREVEAALGDGLKLGPAPEEQEMYQKARRSLVAARAIPRGAVIDRSMIAIKRPGYGIRPKLIDLLVGRVAKVDIEEDTVLTWDLV